jgi:hypothetical protein
MSDKTSLRILVVAITAVAPVAHAQQQVDRALPYDYVFANLAITEIDSGGLEVGGSFALQQNFHLFGGYQDWELNDNVDRSILQVGGGYHWDLSPNLDLTVGVALAKSELDTPGPAEIDDEGLILSAGLRGWASSQLELSGEVLLDDSLGSDTDSVIEIGGQYHISDQLSLGGRVRVDEEETTLFIGGRFHFGRAAAAQP